MNTAASLALPLHLLNSWIYRYVQVYLTLQLCQQKAIVIVWMA